MLGDLRPQGRPDDIETLQEQDAFATLGHFEERRHLGLTSELKFVHRSTWLVQAGWDGAVVTGLTFSDGDVSQAPPAEMILGAPWLAIVPLLERLGGYGPAHLTAMIATTKTTRPLVRGQVAYPPGRPPKPDTLYAKLRETTRMDRLVETETANPAIVAGLARELKRAAGVYEDEPEP